MQQSENTQEAISVTMLENLLIILLKFTVSSFLTIQNNSVLHMHHKPAGPLSGACLQAKAKGPAFQE